MIHTSDKRHGGFTLIETMAVVAVIAALLGLSAVGVAYYRDYLKITELDNAAREIYMAAENRAVLLESGGQLDGALVKATPLSLAGTGGSVYFTRDQAVSNGLLTAGAIDSALLGGEFYIVYDPESGGVTDVFYTEGPEAIQDIDIAFDLAAKGRSKRMRPDSGPMLGYYGGLQAKREDYKPLPAPEVLVEIHNEESLTVDVTFTLPGSGFRSDQKVELIYEVETVDLMASAPPPTFPSHNQTKYTWVLDAIDGPHFWQLFDTVPVCGGDFTVTASMELTAAGHRPTTASGSDTNNSLFAENSGGGTARVENLRHLQNLDTAASKAGGVTSAVLLKDIDCRGADEDAPYAFKPIENDELTSFDAGWTEEGDESRRNELTNLLVTKDSATGKSGAGLFGKMENGMKFSGVRLTGASVSANGGIPCGALVGSAGAGSTFDDIRVVNASAVSDGGPAGGIAGKIEDGSGENKFEDCRVYWEPEEGEDNLRGLLGSDQSSNRYKFSETVSGSNAGGLVGELSDTTGKTKIEKSFAATLVNGEIAGGLIGDAQQAVTVETSYADCYLKGTEYAGGLIGKCKSGGTSVSAEFKNVYAAGFIDLNYAGTGLHAAGITDYTEGAGTGVTLCGTNVYDAMSFLIQTGTMPGTPTRGIPAEGSTANHCYHLNPGQTTSGGPLQENGPLSYDDMTGSAFAGKLGGAFAFKDDPNDVNPYNLQEREKLDKRYSFPGLKGLPHYGDWKAYFKAPSLVYYEEDSKGKIGFSGGNARELIGQLDKDITVRKDGYAVALLCTDLAEKNGDSWDDKLLDFTISYTDIVTGGESTQKVTGELSYSSGVIDAVGSGKIETASWTRTEGGMNVPYEYFLIPLPDELVTEKRTSESFYHYFRFQITGTYKGGGAYEAEGEFFYNPHFAETVSPYIPKNDQPLIDWTDSTAEAGAATTIQNYIDRTLIPGSRPISVSVRTPRHFYHLSQYSDYYHNERLAFQQHLPLDGKREVYNGYPDLLKDGKYDTRGSLIQSPIGTQAESFTGSYNGNCLPIRHITFEVPESAQNNVDAGLFGSSNGTLQNIVYRLNDGDPDAPVSPAAAWKKEFHSTEKRIYLGALVGRNGVNGKISNCSVDGVNLDAHVFSATLYVGGLCGMNDGTVSDSAAEAALLQVEASNYGTAMIGGLAGSNSGQINTSYAVGRLSAVTSESDSKVIAGGFAGVNSGSISNSYTAADLRTDGKASSAYGFSSPGSSGRQSGTYYLNNGNFTYRGQSFLALYEETQAKPLTYMELAAADSPVSGMGKKAGEGETVFPYPTGVKKKVVENGVEKNAPEHYGGWPRPISLGTMGVYYWEELQIDGEEKPSYRISMLVVDPGSEGPDGKKQSPRVTKQSTLSTAHDQGGEVTRFGYGFYNEAGNEVTVVDTLNFQLLYSDSGEKGTDFDQEKYEKLEAAKGEAKSGQLYLDRLVDEKLAELMSYEQKEEGESTRKYSFHSFHSFDLSGDTNGGLYPDAAAAQPNGTLTLKRVDTAGKAVKATFVLNPFFADALAVAEVNSDSDMGAFKFDTGVPQVKNYNNTDEEQTNWTGAPGCSEEFPYGVRSIDQLELIDWNNENRNTTTVMSGTASTDGKNRTAESFPYLNSKNQMTQYYWEQTYDILGEKETDGSYKTYTPIAEYYDQTGGDRGTLTGWFGSVYKGGGYKIENVNIQGQISSCSGLFGVVFDGTLQDIVLYSSDGEGKISTIVGEKTSISRWFYMGAIAGAAGSRNPTGNAIQNCSVAGYSIEATGYTNNQNGDGWGGNIIGGLVGASHMNLTGCSAVVDVNVHDARENDNMRVGGLVGACQGSIANCYAGGSISIDKSTVTILRNKAGIFVGGLVGGSYMKPLKIDGTDCMIGTIGNGVDSTENETNNALTNCYSFVTLPSMDDSHDRIHGLYALGGTGEVYSASDKDTRKANNHGTCTITNCYYLADIVMANNPGKNGKSSEETIINGLIAKKNDSTNNPKYWSGSSQYDWWAVDERKTDVGTIAPGDPVIVVETPTPEKTSVYNPVNGRFKYVLSIKGINYYTDGDPKDGAPLFTRSGWGL